MPRPSFSTEPALTACELHNASGSPSRVASIAAPASAITVSTWNFSTGPPAVHSSAAAPWAFPSRRLASRSARASIGPDVGVPPSGPMDALALRLANRLLGNAQGAAALECTAGGPVLKFHVDTVIALAGAAMDATLDGEPLALWSSQAVNAGSVLKLGRGIGAGLRTYLAVAGGFDVPDYLGAKATFTLGRFGGHAGRTLRVGDMLHFTQTDNLPEAGLSLPP